MTIGGVLKWLIIRFFDNFLPLKGKLKDNGFLIIKDFLPKNLCTADTAKIYEYLKNSKEVQEVVLDYTGKSEIEFYEKWIAPTTSSSGLWHHDSVGHRVKAFISLVDSEAGTGTEIIPGANKNKYSSYNETRLSEVKNSDAVLVKQKAGDLLLFDTNCPHRGIYGSGRRIIFQAEYNTGMKGKILPGHIGSR